MRRTVAVERRRERAHSHTRTTRQSDCFKVRVTSRSRALLRASFVSQNTAFVFGFVACLGAHLRAGK